MQRTKFACLAGLMFVSGCVAQSAGASSGADAASSMPVYPDTMPSYKEPASKCTHGCDKAYIPYADVIEKSSATCTAMAKAFGESSAKSAVVQVSADAAAQSCGGAGANTVAESSAKDMAHAVATAIAETSTSCETTGYGKACAVADAQAHETAYAIAEVSAEAFASAAMECGCKVDAQSMSATVGEAIAVAHAQSHSDVCVSGDASAAASSYVSAFTKTFINLWASAIAKARTGSECKAFVDITANFKVWNDHGNSADSMLTLSADGNGDAQGNADGNGYYKDASGKPVDEKDLWAPKDDSSWGGHSGAMCFNQGGCCRHALQGWVHGKFFKENCDRCDFEIRDSKHECDKLKLVIY